MLVSGIWGHQNVKWEAPRAPSWEVVNSLCGQRHECGFVIPPERYQLRAFVVWNGAALEVGGTKMNGSGLKRMT